LPDCGGGDPHPGGSGRSNFGIPPPQGDTCVSRLLSCCISERVASVLAIRALGALFASGVFGTRSALGNMRVARRFSKLMVPSAALIVVISSFEDRFGSNRWVGLISFNDLFGYCVREQAFDIFQ